MVNPKNDRKKENFGLIQDVVNDPIKLIIAIAIIVLLLVLIYFLLMNKKQAGAGMMELMSDTSPMAPLSATPAMQ